MSDLKHCQGCGHFRYPEDLFAFECETCCADAHAYISTLSAELDKAKKEKFDLFLWATEYELADPAEEYRQRMVLRETRDCKSRGRHRIAKGRGLMTRDFRACPFCKARSDRILALEAELVKANALLDEVQMTVDNGYGEHAEYYSANLEDILAKRRDGDDEG